MRSSDSINKCIGEKCIVGPAENAHFEKRLPKQIQASMHSNGLNLELNNSTQMCSVAS